jgi:hypothetical protein
VESINFYNYIINHTTTDALKNIRPEEAWTKNNLDLIHFHIFGSEARAQILDEKGK